MGREAARYVLFESDEGGIAAVGAVLAIIGTVGNCTGMKAALPLAESGLAVRGTVGYCTSMKAALPLREDIRWACRIKRL